MLDDGVGEGIVHRALDEDLVALVGHGKQQQIDGGHNAGRIAEPQGVGLPAVASLLPVDVGLIKFGVKAGVSNAAMLGGLDQRVANGGRHAKVHIRHPEGEQVFIAKHLLETSGLPLGLSSAGSVNALVKVILHNRNFLSLVT